MLAGPLPVVHAVTDSTSVLQSGFVDRATSVMEALGVRGAVHLRCSRASGRQFHDIAAKLVLVQNRTGCWLIVNDRVDVAIAAVEERRLAVVRIVDQLVGKNEVARRAAQVQADLRDARLRLLADDLIAMRGTLEAEVRDETALRERRTAVEQELTAARALVAIGGAGTFDSIFLAGVLSVLLATI